MDVINKTSFSVSFLVLDLRLMQADVRKHSRMTGRKK